MVIFTAIFAVISMYICCWTLSKSGIKQGVILFIFLLISSLPFMGFYETWKDFSPIPLLYMISAVLSIGAGFVIFLDKNDLQGSRVLAITSVLTILIPTYLIAS